MLHFGIRSLLRVFSLTLLPTFGESALPDIPEKPMVVFIASYNNQKWVRNNLVSVFLQDYSNYRVVYVDDASEDGTVDAVESFVRKYSQASRFTLIRNRTRKGGLHNLYHAVNNCADEEIIVNLDGDDWFANKTVLKKLNTVYSTREVWLTHGTMIEYPKNTLGWSIPIPEKVIEKNAFRNFRCPSHLKTFYAWLFKKIDIEDLKFEGEFFLMTWDQAIMFPMIEMAGNRHAFIPDILYIYNTGNPINDNKVNAKLQNDLEKLIRSNPKYERLQEAP